MTERIIDEVCETCGHSAGRHFQDVIGKVRCLHTRIYTSRMTGDSDAVECSCVDYVLTDSHQKKAKYVD